ncbi:MULTISPECIES: oligoribonuclease [Lacisediminihabitans]|uniref:Oligoribonuclease n=1 Tax=Lacisediminihabitans profunda TaxID=2594790 RepID=A0A5C8UJ68_9MICO|nr:oligoribonuclease [Lacisediminihabitans profunda]TXN28084.1 oligoribonuclease [Lacisediminihabitans profunda]
MTDALPTLAHGDEYIVLYKGGPNDGQVDKRISTDGSFDDEITVLTAVDGKETLLDYTRSSWTEVGGQYHVVYDFDLADSEPVEAPEDRGGRQ